MFMGARRSCILIPVGVYLSVVLRCSYSLHLTPDNKLPAALTDYSTSTSTVGMRRQHTASRNAVRSRLV
jgi:hypothetical protein